LKNISNPYVSCSKLILTIEIYCIFFKYKINNFFSDSINYIKNIVFNLFFFFLRKYEHAIRTYEGDDPLAPYFEYMKWLEQIYLKHGPESNLFPLIEETVQKFKNDSKYKQDPRFITILINFVNIHFTS